MTKRSILRPALAFHALPCFRKPSNVAATGYCSGSMLDGSTMRRDRNSGSGTSNVFPASSTARRMRICPTPWLMRTTRALAYSGRATRRAVICLSLLSAECFLCLMSPRTRLRSALLHTLRSWWPRFAADSSSATIFWRLSATGDTWGKQPPVAATAASEDGRSVRKVRVGVQMMSALTSSQASSGSDPSISCASVTGATTSVWLSMAPVRQSKPNSMHDLLKRWPHRSPETGSTGIDSTTKRSSLNLASKSTGSPSRSIPASVTARACSLASIFVGSSRVSIDVRECLCGTTSILPARRAASRKGIRASSLPTRTHFEFLNSFSCRTRSTAAPKPSLTEAALPLLLLPAVRPRFARQPAPVPDLDPA
mmetsp:Transcript_113016/g.326580  ORF Transcript_113016/g.326580 Transcript_113016/m.326580 type:complete len:368 (+) Transcript_113016:496-1599(+)